MTCPLEEFPFVRSVRAGPWPALSIDHGGMEGANGSAMFHD